MRFSRYVFVFLISKEYFEGFCKPSKRYIREKISSCFLLYGLLSLTAFTVSSVCHLSPFGVRRSTWDLMFTLSCSSFLPRKEVIQPHLPIRLPCYDFTPVIRLTFGSWLLAFTSLTSGASGSHGVTGGVYKSLERIHRGILIRDY